MFCVSGHIKLMLQELHLLNLDMMHYIQLSIPLRLGPPGLRGVTPRSGRRRLWTVRSTESKTRGRVLVLPIPTSGTQMRSLCVPRVRVHRLSAPSTICLKLLKENLLVQKRCQGKFKFLLNPKSAAVLESNFPRTPLKTLSYTSLTIAGILRTM
ncbi:MAG: hypothetical protein [Cressdnaviricota sp.]|nr:MAG: hypothetical protein [Cressdnaviricota sp.]